MYRTSDERLGKAYLGDAYVMETFDNVRVYNLMMKLLGIEEYAPTNGTTGFWDR